ncbi:MAG: hypothetical protein GDA43_09025 [Hormoscilla sp. SP5CHS1]|nr:hypothetical protein [Hormoscilla sp. SP5CHS1]
MLYISIIVLQQDLTYYTGVLKRHATRDDSTKGEDVTQNVQAIRSIPLRHISLKTNQA